MPLESECLTPRPRHVCCPQGVRGLAQGTRKGGFAHTARPGRLTKDLLTLQHVSALIQAGTWPNLSKHMWTRSARHSRKTEDIPEITKGEGGGRVTVSVEGLSLLLHLGIDTTLL